tara:strand:- start:2692 stop:3240 length:549 start_codon:yes stop_codon:yes gene_type:complete
MKGVVLNIKILIAIAIVSGVVMSSMSVYESWSQHHLTSLDLLYYTCLGSIYALLLFASFAHKDANIKLSDRFNGVYLRNLLRPAAYLFFLTFIFGINNSKNWIKMLHYIFTFSAIVVSYVSMWMWAYILKWDQKSVRMFLLIGTVIGAMGIGFGFFTNFISLSWGETIVSIPLAVWLVKTVD